MLSKASCWAQLIAKQGACCLQAVGFSAWCPSEGGDNTQGAYFDFWACRNFVSIQQLLSGAVQSLAGGFKPTRARLRCLLGDRGSKEAFFPRTWHLFSPWSIQLALQGLELRLITHPTLGSPTNSPRQGVARNGRLPELLRGLF